MSTYNKINSNFHQVANVDTNGDVVTMIPTKGGTGQNTYIAGDILYANTANTLAKLPVGANGTILTISSGLPSWQVSNAATVGDCIVFAIALS